MSVLRAMPGVLLAVFAVFLAMPLWSLSFLEAPWRLVETRPAGEAALLIAAYWVIPLL